VVEPFRHHWDDRRESALDFVGHSQGEYEVLAGGAHIFRRSQDGAEIVARMSETARRHITVEEIDIARQAGVEERRLIQCSLAASDQRAAAWGPIFLELFAQRRERSTRQGRDRAGEAIQNVALEQLADFRCQALLPSRSGKGGDAFDHGPCFLPRLARHRTLRCAGHADGLQLYTHDTPPSVCLVLGNTGGLAMRCY
jgi:hypothetical protein